MLGFEDEDEDEDWGLHLDLVSHKQECICCGGCEVAVGYEEDAMWDEECRRRGAAMVMVI